ncbi:hypothetical protein EDB92DRAFT_1887878 [Lactarius akahatsu]|uniref:RING-type domain-containing protein n=1 Tax=Lactarius akahatsu TaxID=416441 RepID=A0AAD4Q7D5_9AGAM|nr:hypothetical protein EDB92DRAFT_1887878 [Lactarius akahatsu]
MTCSVLPIAMRAISTSKSISSVTASRRGKKRALEDLATDPEGECDTDAHGIVALTSATATSIKRAKRAETRECPICGDHIPLRLLGQHYTLESTRVQTILDHVGDLDAFSDPHAPPHAPSLARRRAASSYISETSAVCASRLTKTLGSIKRRRKARNMALRTATRDEDDLPLAGKGKARAGAREQCPVCMQDVEGDPDVVAAHIDACLAHAELGLAEGHADDSDMDGDVPQYVNVDGYAEEDGDDDVDLWEESEAPDGVRRLRLRGGCRATAAAAAALGFAVGDRTAADIEDEIDVEGDDLGTFGAAQFTEADVLAEGSDRTVPGHHDMGRHAGVVGLDLEIECARHGKDPQELISALESKVQRLATAASEGSALGCRICLEAYSEPTVSTGCWHACCSACWLRCLKATGVCPICKRITVAGDLRRIYL